MEYTDPSPAFGKLLCNGTKHDVARHITALAPQDTRLCCRPTYMYSYTVAIDISYNKKVVFQ